MIMPAPKRRHARQNHLDAHLVPFESALLCRAGFLDDQNDEAMQEQRRPDPVKREIAQQFRELAEELYYW